MAAFGTNDKHRGLPGPSAAASLREQRVVAACVFAGLLAMPVAFWRAGGCRGGLADHDRPPRRDTRFRVDLNAASRVELMQLPGIGPTMADRIMAIRETNGHFSSVDDLAGVPGIGDVTLERIRPYLRVPKRAADDVRTGEPLPPGR